MDLGDNSSFTEPLTNVSLNSTDVAIVSPFFAIRSTLMIVTAGLFSFVGITGNLLFILCYWLEKKLRTVSSFLISMLSLADLMACIGVILVYMVMANRLSSASMCWYWLKSLPLFPIISMYCQFLISVDRTTRLTQSNVIYTKCFSMKLATLYVFLGWIFQVTLIILWMTVDKPPDVRGEHRCNSIELLRSTREQMIYIMDGCSIIYFGMACVCYGRLIYYVRRRRIAVSSSKQAYVRTSITLLVLCIIAVSSTVVPPFLLYISFHFTKNPRIYAALDEVGTTVFFLGFSLNPVVYGYRIKMFREKLKSLFSLCFARKVAPHPVTDSEPRVVADQGKGILGKSRPPPRHISELWARRVVSHPVTDSNPGDTSSRRKKTDSK